MAALEDALDRVKQQLLTETQYSPAGSRKRPLDDEDEGPRHKRVKTEPRQSQRKKVRSKTKIEDRDKDKEVEGSEDISTVS